MTPAACALKGASSAAAARSSRPRRASSTPGAASWPMALRPSWCSPGATAKSRDREQMTDREQDEATARLSGQAGLRARRRRMTAFASWSIGCGRAGSQREGAHRSVAQGDRTEQRAAPSRSRRPKQVGRIRRGLRPRTRARAGEERGRDLARKVAAGPVTLLYAARNETHNNAVALKDWLERTRSTLEWRPHST